MNAVKVHWKHHVAGLADVQIDFGDLSGHGKHFLIGMEIRIVPPPVAEESTATEQLAWQDRTSMFIRGDVSSLLNYPPGVILSNYLLRIHESETSDFPGYTTFVLKDLFYAKNGAMIHAAHTASEAKSPGVRRTNWPEPEKKE